MFGEFPEAYREIIRLAYFETNKDGQLLLKRELAAKFRELGFLKKAKDRDDTRQVQELIDAAVRFLSKRDLHLSDIEQRSFVLGGSGELFDKYPVLKFAILVN